MRTIAAIATPRGEGGISVVRISGVRAEEILEASFRPSRHIKRPFDSHRMMYGRCVDGEGKTIDEVMAVLMRAPNSYTREDVAEIQCHGGVCAARKILQRVTDLGASPAQPGEFTRRAFENGRLSLNEAEAVMGVVSAASEAALLSSVRELEGGSLSWLRACRDDLTKLLSYIEAAADFPEEMDEDVTQTEVASRAEENAESILKRVDERRARFIRDGVSVVLCGRPNVGKSSLMNALVGYDKAIVTDIPGTTRDVLVTPMSIGGVRVELSDTAGIREASDQIEKIGVDRARRALQGADVVLIVLDASEPLCDEDRRILAEKDGRSIVVVNKTDIACPQSDDIRADARVSAKDGSGLDVLLRLIEEKIGGVRTDEMILTNIRQMTCARGAAELLKNAALSVREGTPVDVAAVDIWEARRLIGEITGEDATEAVIDAVFATFCVGK